MKKIAALLLCCALLCGCWTIPGVVHNVTNILGKTEDVLCNPTADQVADAIQAISWIKANPEITIGYYLQVFMNIREGVCVTLAQLKDALSQFDEVVACMTDGELKAMKDMGVPPLMALRKAVQ